MNTKHIKRLCKALTASAFGILVISTSCMAATYYVDNVNGSDNNSGTASSSPWKTIAKVNGSSFNPGDSILFAAGETWQEQLNPPSSGAAGQPITFGAYGTGAMPTINGNQTLQYNIYWNKSYITVDGLHLTQAANCSISQWSAEADYGIVQNCLLDYAYGMGIYVGQSASLTAKNWIVRNNVFNHSGVSGTPARHDIYIKWATGWLIENNQFTNGQDSALDINGSSNNIVRWNYSSGHSNCFVQFYEDTAGGATNNQIYYNVSNGDYSLIYSGGGNDNAGNVIYNNVSYNATGGIYMDSPGGTLSAVQNNIFYDISGTVLNNTSLMGTVSNNDLNTYNPLFVSAGTNFNLTASSPCRKAGVYVGLTTDMAGNSVPSGSAPDIGAYQYQSSGANTLNPPTNLQVQ